MAGGRRGIRANFRRCNSFVKYLAQSANNIALADAADRER
jgi:hypothetical protein